MRKAGSIYESVGRYVMVIGELTSFLMSKKFILNLMDRKYFKL